MTSTAQPPALSVLIPARDPKEHLGDLIDTVASLPEGLEVVIVNDGSTDGSEADLDDLARRFPNVVVVHTDGVGVAEARQLAIQASSGVYLWFADVDDRPLPAVMSRYLPLLATQKYDMIVFDAIRRFPDGSTELISDGTANQFLGSGQEGLLAIYKGALTGHLWNKVFRRSILARIEIPKLTTREDLAACLLTIPHCTTVRAISETVYNYHVHGGSLLNSPSFRFNDLLHLEQRATDIGVARGLPTDAIANFRVREIIFPIVNESLRRNTLTTAIRTPPFRAALQMVKPTKSGLPFTREYASIRLRLAILQFVDGRLYGAAYKMYRRLRWSLLDAEIGAAP